jgi:sugar/nucleoside kinase (ribokinase family)
MNLQSKTDSSATAETTRQTRHRLARPLIIIAASFAASALSAPVWAATIQGTTFMDRNDNGLKDSGEPLLLTKPTLFIRHNPTADAGEGGFYTTEADENGNYSFILYDTGSYTIWSEMPHGWHQTTPARGQGIAFYDFTVSNNEQTVTIDFGFLEPTADNGPETPDNPTSPAPNTTESAPNTNPTSPAPTDDKADVTPTSGSTPSASIWSGTIQGTTFMDENNNGLKDSGEPARPTKTTIFIRHNPTVDAGEGGFYTTEADENGNYSFILYDTGSYTIWSEMPLGWEQTAPIRGENIAFYDFTLSNNQQSVTIDFGFIEPTAHNGPETPDNPTSPAPNTTEPAPNTNPTPPAPTDDKADVTPSSGSDNTPSAPTWNGTVQGTTFIDENNNGLKDSGEPPQLTKTTLFIRHNPTADAGEGGFYTTETDENGNYSFILYDTGSYTIWSEMPHGWEQTAPIRGEGIAFYDFTLSNNEQTVTIDFGFIEPTADNGPETPDNPTSPAPNTEPTPPAPTDDKADVTPSSGSDNTPSAPTWNGTVQGTTFMDKNNNGLKDSGEPARLTKTTLFIRHNPTADAGEGGFYTTETDENGNYSFILYDTGSYTIWSEMPHGWEQTAPIRGEGIAFYDFTLSNNEQTVTIDFGFIEPTADNGPPQPNTYSAEFSHTQHIIGEPNTQVPISLALFNTGPNNDTYTINVANTAAWALTSSEQTLTIKSQQRENLELNITLPSTHGAETRVTVTAQSQNDPKVEAVATFPVSVTAQQLTTPRGDEEADFTLVIEDTALMAGENLKIANALENILAADIDATMLLTFELITFKGNNIVSRLVTQDMGELIGLLRSLIPAGGDDCANASIAALDSALPYIYNGQILLATAAPPHNTDTTQLIAQAQQQATKINILLAGTCGKPETDTALYKTIADKTGGTFQWLPRGLTSPEESQQVITTTLANLITELVGYNIGIVGDNTGNTTGDNTDTTGDTDTQNTDATIDVNIPTPATCQLYGVMQDSANNRTIFAYEPQTDSVSELADVTEHGQMPAITAHPDTNTLYIASQNLSKLDAQTGQLTDVGDTAHQHISSLAFDYQRNLLAWAQGTGLIQIDIETAQSTVVLPTQIPLEDFTANLAGDTLYALIGPNLWRYDPATHDIAKQCDNLPDAAKVVKVLPETILPEGLVLLGMHQDNILNLHIFDINNCQLITNKDITMPTDIKNLGIFTVPMAACRQ